MTTTSEQQAAPVAQVDWRTIAKAAGEHGVRYRTNTALLAFLDAIEPARKADRFDAARLTPIEGVAASGMVLVPREPTEAMVGAGRRDLGFAEGGYRTGSQKAKDCWASMLAATPSPAIPEGTSGEGVERREAILDILRVALAQEKTGSKSRSVILVDTVAKILEFDPIPDATQTREAELEAALKPFSEACNFTTADDSESLYDTLAAEKLTWRDLRRARAALSAGAAKGEAR